jgi:hypothetical protein
MIAIRIRKSAADAIPVRVEGSDRLVTSRSHSLDCFLPAPEIRKIEDQSNPL